MKIFEIFRRPQNSSKVVRFQISARSELTGPNGNHLQTLTPLLRPLSQELCSYNVTVRGAALYYIGGAVAAVVVILIIIIVCCCGGDAATDNDGGVQISPSLSQSSKWHTL